MLYTNRRKFEGTSPAEIAFTSLEWFGLSPVEQAATLGVKINSDAEFDELRMRMKARMSDGERERSKLLFEICFAVYALCGEERISAWLNNKDELLGGATPRELLVTGEIQNIGKVLCVLQKLVGLH